MRATTGALLFCLASAASFTQAQPATKPLEPVKVLKSSDRDRRLC